MIIKTNPEQPPLKKNHKWLSHFQEGKLSFIITNLIFIHFLCRISQEEYDDGDGWKADHFYSEEDHSTIAEEVNKVVFCCKICQKTFPSKESNSIFWQIE